MRIPLLLILFCLPLTAADDPVPEPTQNFNAAFRLFRTQNIHTFLKLDTRTGQVWQLQWSIESQDHRFVEEINPVVLSRSNKVGRFTLYPTGNMHNFVLLDQEDGRSWQVQWSMELENRLVFVIDASASAWEAVAEQAEKKLKAAPVAPKKTFAPPPLK